MARAAAVVFAAALLTVPGAVGSVAQTPQRGGTLVFGGYLEPTCLSVANGCDLGPLLAIVLEGAFGLENHRWTGGLIADVMRTKDPLTLVYRIRPEARWSDGTPVTSADFEFTRRVWIEQGLASVGEKPWRRFRTLGAKRFEVTLAARSAHWRLFPLFVLPRHVLEGQDLKRVWKDGVVDPKTGRPIGSGAFLSGRWERGKQITLLRNPRYWGSRAPSLDRIVVRFVRDSAGIDALLAGDVDVLPVQGPFQQEAVARLTGVPGIRLRRYPGLNREHLAIRLGAAGHPALQSKLVRRALAYGIDRDAIVRDLFGEVMPSLRPLQSLLFLAEHPGYRPNWSRYRYRPETARRLLEQAGCQRGADGVFQCAGERLRLRFVTTAGSARRQRTLALLQAQLSQIGVVVVPEYAANLAFLARGDFDVALFAWGSDWPDDVPADAYRCQGERNVSGYCNRLATRDLAQLGSIVDPDLFARAVNAADEKLARDVPAIPLFQPPTVDAHRTSVRGLGRHAYPYYLNLEDWWLARGN